MKGFIFVLISTVISIAKADRGCGVLQSGKTIPDPEDCSSFYLCVDGILLPMECPIGLQYDFELGICYSQSNCEAVTEITPTSGSSTTVSIPTAPTIIPTVSTISTSTFAGGSSTAITPTTQVVNLTDQTPPAYSPPNPCKNMPTGVYLNDFDYLSCQGFLYCYHGSSMQSQCPGHYQFDFFHQVCSEEGTVPCPR